MGDTQTLTTLSWTDDDRKQTNQSSASNHLPNNKKGRRSHDTLLRHERYVLGAKNQRSYPESNRGRRNAPEMIRIRSANPYTIKP
jgi:hypothetical protein